MTCFQTELLLHAVVFCHQIPIREQYLPLFTPTKDGGPPICVATKREDVGVVSGDKDHCVLLTGEPVRLVNGRVEHDSLSQCSIGYRFMVAMIDAAPCRKPVTERWLSLCWAQSPSFCQAQPLTFHKEIEAVGVPAKHAHGHLCHLRQGRVLGWVSVDVILHEFRLKEA